MSQTLDQINGGLNDPEDDPILSKMETTDHPDAPVPTEISSVYDKLFETIYIDNVKYGGCITCGKRRNGRYKVKFKHFKGRTYSLKKHLEKAHKEIHDIFFPSEKNDAFVVTSKKSSNIVSFLLTETIADHTHVKKLVQMLSKVGLKLI